jgi:hypothetical protein
VVLADEAQAWSDLGLVPDGTFDISYEALTPFRRGLVALGVCSDDETLSPVTLDVDGVEVQMMGREANRVGGSGTTEPDTVQNRTGAIDRMGLDHVVVLTDDLDRTCGAVEGALGAPRRRVRAAGGGVRQGFHRLGPTLLEIVESPRHEPGPARLWGIAVTVEDLDATAARLGTERCRPPRPAVQPGRRIATLTREAGVATIVALMSAAVPRPDITAATP